MVLAHAENVQQLMGDLMPDEQPQPWVWGVPEAINQHLKRVSEKRKNKKPGDTSDDVDWDDEDKWVQYEIPEGWR